MKIAAYKMVEEEMVAINVIGLCLAA